MKFQEAVKELYGDMKNKAKTLQNDTNKNIDEIKESCYKDDGNLEYPNYVLSYYNFSIQGLEKF